VLEDAALRQYAEDLLAGLFAVNPGGTTTKCQHRNVKKRCFQKHHRGNPPPLAAW